MSSVRRRRRRRGQSSLTTGYSDVQADRSIRLVISTHCSIPVCEQYANANIRPEMPYFVVKITIFPDCITLCFFTYPLDGDLRIKTLVPFR